MASTELATSTQAEGLTIRSNNDHLLKIFTNYDSIKQKYTIWLKEHVPYGKA